MGSLRTGLSVRYVLVAALALSALAVEPSGAQGVGGGGEGAGPALWATVDAGYNHTCGIRDTGRLYCWGLDADGALGNGSGLGDQLTPSEVTGGHTDWVAVSAGLLHSCGRRATGRLYCWGSDADGELGEGPGTADKQSPVPVTGAWTNANAPGAGGSHTCATRVGGRLYCWGADSRGQLGEGAGAGDQQNPVEVNSAPPTGPR